VAAAALELGDQAGAAELFEVCRAEARLELDGLANTVTPRFELDELVLAPAQARQLREIVAAMGALGRVHHDWGTARAWNEGGLSVLFCGPPGTGKTMAAEALAQTLALPMYRIDLSQVVNKYIGETEKNLRRIFDAAETSDCLMFFDEADALFGKRTATSSSNDRHANQEVSYLLQRVEDFPGTVILATNLKANIDDAFARRFQSMVHFPMPDAEQRLRLWEGMVQHTGRLAGDVNLAQLADEHELAGGAIANVVRFGAINALQRGRKQIEASDLQRGIVKELRKEGRTT